MKMLLVLFVCLLACPVSGQMLTTENWDTGVFVAVDSLVLDSGWWEPTKPEWIRHPDQWYIKSVDTTVKCDSCPTIKWDGTWAVDFDCLPLKSDSVVRRNNWGVYWITEIDTVRAKKMLFWVTPEQQVKLLRILE